MKIRTLGRHVKEGTRNIVRNGWMTFSAVSAVTVTLLILGVFLILAMNVNYMVQSIENQVEIMVELELNIDQSQVATIDNKIKNIDGIKSVTFVPKEEGLEQLKEWFGEDADLLAGLEGEENPLHDVFIVKVEDPNTIGSIAQIIETYENISLVDYGKTTVENLFLTSKWIRNIGVVFIVGLAFTAMFLISNTIKMTIYSRRREIEIMKLVGATNWFIRWPFFVEGFLLGVFGSVIPIASLIFGYKFLLKHIGSDMVLSFIELLPMYPFVYQVSILLVAIGAFIGIWGSMMSVRRFLKI